MTTAETVTRSESMRAIITAINSDGDKAPRSRHIDIRYYITREALANGTLRLKYIQTTDIIINILTKPLAAKAHYHHMKGMSLAE